MPQTFIAIAAIALLAMAAVFRGNDRRLTVWENRVANAAGVVFILSSFAAFGAWWLT